MKRPLTLTSASDSILPRSDAATQVYVADSRMSLSIRTFLPIGMLSSGVSSNAPSLHFTNGIGDPMATQVRLTDPPGMTSTFSGGIEKCGGTRRTVHTKQWCEQNQHLKIKTKTLELDTKTNDAYR